MKKIVLFLFPLLVISSGCDVNDSNDSSDSLYLEIVNDVASVTTESPYFNLLSGDIQVTVSSDNAHDDWDGYDGSETVTLQEGQRSQALRVSNKFNVQVNGEDFAPGRFGISNPPRDTWVLKIQAIQSRHDDSYYYVWDLSVK